MRKLTFLIAVLSCLALSVVAHVRITIQDIPKESKTQPKEVTLSKDSQSDKYGEVPFNHENHATKMYSVDGKSVILCVECHHTDQPAAGLKAPLKTSERDVVLTAAVLEDSAPMPAVTYPDKPGPTKLTNEVAYHMNCNICHDKALAARPALKGKAYGSNDCLPCHKPVN
jgi:hypothetical protein